MASHHRIPYLPLRLSFLLLSILISSTSSVCHLPLIIAHSLPSLPGLYYKLHGVHRPDSMKKTVIKRRKRVPAAAAKPGASANGHSSGADGKTTAAEAPAPDPSGAPYHPSLNTAHDESYVQMSDRAAAEALVAVGRVRRYAEAERERDHSSTPHRVPSPDGWGDGEPKRKRQRKEIDGPVHDDRPMDYDMDARHSQQQRHPTPGVVKTRDSPSDMALRIVDKGTRPPSIPPPPSERLETTTLTLSSSSVGRGLSRSGTPADPNARDNGFNHNNHAHTQSAPPPSSASASAPVPVPTSGAGSGSSSGSGSQSGSHSVHSNQHRASHSNSQSHAAASPLPTGRPLDHAAPASTHLSHDAHSHSQSQNGYSHPPESENRSNGEWKRSRYNGNGNGVGVDLPPLSDIQVDVSRDESIRGSARRPSWTPREREDLSSAPYSGPSTMHRGSSQPSPLSPPSNSLPLSLPTSSSTRPLPSGGSPRVQQRDESGEYANGHPSSARISPSDSKTSSGTAPPFHQHPSSHASSRHSHSISPEISLNNHHHLSHSAHGTSSSRPPSRSPPLLSAAELEAHYYELRTQKKMWEAMLDKTNRMLDDLRRAIDDTRDRERRPPSAGRHPPLSMPLPERASVQKNGGKVWAWTNGVEKEH